MAVETANRAAENLLAPALLTPATRDDVLANSMPSFIVAGDGLKILWSSHEAARRLGFRDGEAAMQAGLPPRAAGSERLAALGAALGPDAPKRLERLRFAIGFRSLALTSLCQSIRLADGSYALLVALVEARQIRDDGAMGGYEAAAAPAPIAVVPVEPPVADQAGISTSEVSVKTSASDADTLTHAPDTPQWLTRPASERRAIRFVFALDANGIVEKVTPPLAEAVGAANADLLGLPLAGTIGAFDPEAAEAIRGAILGGDTWSGISVRWPVSGTDLAIPVELSALPLISGDAGLTGFSGFGRCHVDRAELRPTEALEPAATPVSDQPDSDVENQEAATPDAVSRLDHEAAVEPDPDLARADEAARAESDLFSALLAFGGSEPDALPAAEEVVDAEPSTPLETSGNAEGSEAPEAARSRAERGIPTQPTQAVPGSPNVVSLRSDQPSAPEQPSHIKSGLSMSERNAFREIARALGAKFDPDVQAAANGEINAGEGNLKTPASPTPPAADVTRRDASPLQPNGAMLDLLPIGLLVLRDDMPLYANRTLLDLTGYVDFSAFLADDGARAIFRKGSFPRNPAGGLDTVVLSTRDGEMFPVDAHLQVIDWEGGKASLISLRRAIELEQGKALRSVALDLKRIRAEAQELRAILDTATDGVVTLDEKGRILSVNGAAEALFGLSQNEIAGESFTVLLRNESHAEALDYLEGLNSNGVRSVLNDGREVFGREKKGGQIPLFMTLGRISDDEPRRYCAVLRDLTSWKRAEADLTEARRAAEIASAKKSDFLTKISHEIRTPMNAIIGFSEVMMEERLGAIGNPKYKEYLGDIRTSGTHVVSLVNDLLDLAKIEAGRMEMNFAATDLNAVLASSVAIIQPQANANRVLVRTQLAQKLPPVVADERSIRQIILNMLSNATRFTEAGGQVIVATALLESGEAVIRIRDTGVGMSAREIEQALEPFRQVGTRRDHGGTGLGLPLTKALVEANRANFAIRSTPGEGTMVEVTFPSTRVLAE